MAGRIAITYASGFEGKTILKAFEGPVKIKSGVHTKDKFLIFKTGVGKWSSKKSSKTLFNMYPVRAIFSLGFAGSLDKELKSSYIIAADKIINASSELKPTEEFSHNSDFFNDVCIKLRERGFKLKKGSLVTVDEPLLLSKDKAKYRDAFKADACDMETAVLAEHAAKNSVPLFSIRVISDGANQNLPDIEYILIGNKPLKEKIKLCLKLILSPKNLIRLIICTWKAYFAFKKLNKLTLALKDILK
jgi:nucleoside phosphorylase